MSTVAWIVVIVIVVLLVIAIAALARSRQQLARRHEAEDRRAEAAGDVPHLDESGRRAQEAQAEAEAARVRAERAESQAQHAQQTHDVERAEHEDRVREADRIDPDVDHKASDYEPRTPLDETRTDDRGEPGDPAGPVERR